MKKTILTLGTIGTIAAPIAAVISCGPEVKDSAAELENVTLDSLAGELAAEKELGNASDSETITMTVRSDEEERYQKIVDKFNSLHKGTVTLRTTKSQGDPDYSGEAARGDLSDIFIANMGTMLKVKRGNWGRALDINSIFAEENRSVYDVEPAAQQPLTVEAGKKPTSLFDKDHLKLNSNKNGVAFALPQGFGSNAVLMNTTMLDPSKNTIHDYVPLKTQDTASTDPSEQTGIKELTGPGHTFTKKPGETVTEFVQRYLFEGGKSSNATEHIQGAADWLGHGPGSLYQRIYSASRSLMYTRMIRSGVFALSLKESMCDFALFASAGINGLVDSDGVMTKEAFSKALKNPASLQKLKDYYYAAILGYSNPAQTLGTAPIMNYNYISKERGTNAGEHQGFHTRQSMFLVTPKWGLDYVENFWGNKYDFSSTLKIPSGNSYTPYDSFFTGKNGHPPMPSFETHKGVSSGQIAVLSAPYVTVKDADSWAISKTVSSPAKLLLAKRFLKWMYTSTDKLYKTVGADGKDVWHATASATDIQNGTAKARTIGEAQDAKISSSFAPISDKQIASHDIPSGIAVNGVKDATGTSSDIYNGVGGKVWQKFDTDYWTAWTSKFLEEFTEKMYKIDRTESLRKTPAQFNSLFDSTIAKYFEAQELE